jgi:hypothetical protein
VILGELHLAEQAADPVVADIAALLLRFWYALDITIDTNLISSALQ